MDIATYNTVKPIWVMGILSAKNPGTILSAKNPGTLVAPV